MNYSNRGKSRHLSTLFLQKFLYFLSAIIVSDWQNYRPNIMLAELHRVVFFSPSMQEYLTSGPSTLACPRVAPFYSVSFSSSYK
jgi:hypothetical protein